MKNLFKSMMLVAAAAMGFTACSKDATEEVAPETKGATKTITVVTDITRTQFGDSRDKLVWSEGDEFGVFTDVATDKNISSGTYVPEGSYTLEVAENATMIYAYYPRNTYSDSRTAQTVSITIPQNQTQTAPAVFNGSYMTMTAKGAIEGTSVNLKFAPVACALALNVYNGESGETIESIAFTSNEECCGYDNAGNDITADELNYKGYNKTATVTVGTEEAPVVIPADAASVDDKLTFDNQIYLVVARKAYSEGAKFVVTTSKNTYTFTTKKALDCSTYDFMPVNLDLTKGETPAPVATKTYAKVTTAPADWTGTYIIAYKDNVMTGAFREGYENKYLAKDVATAYDEAGNTITCSSAYEITIEKSATDGYYTLKNSEGKYIGWSSSTNAQFGDTPSSDSFLWELNITGQTISNKANSARNTRYNGSSDYRVYSGTSTGSAPDFYTISGPRVSVTEKEFAIAADDTAEHTFTCTVSGEGAELTDVTLTQDDASKSWLTASYADGTVTYKAAANETDAPRTATLTLAIADGNSVEITVTQAAPIKKLVVTLSVEGTTVSWTADGNVSGYNYTVTADAAGTGDVLKRGENVEETSLDLSTLGLETGTYYLHVQALGDGIATSDSDIVTSEGIAVEKGENPSLTPGTVLWAETFGNVGTGETTFTKITTYISTYDYSGRTGYEDNAKVTYTSDATNQVRITKSSGANMTSSHLWFNKSQAGVFTTSPIKLYGATNLQFSFATSKGKTITSYSTNGGTTWVSLGTNTTANANKSYTFTVNSDTQAILIKIEHDKADATNTRVDNLKLEVAE